MNSFLKNPTLSIQAARDFSLKWKDASSEKKDAESFWNDFFRQLCGVEDNKISGIEFQYEVRNSVKGTPNYIDVYWKNVALFEHKSKGEDLEKAELQARGYRRNLPPGYRPRYLVISDFANIRIVDENLERTYEFKLENLSENIHRFEHIISGSKPHSLEEEITVDQTAAMLMANLYKALESNGYEGHETSIFLVRLLFLLFGDDTNMWENNIVKKMILATNQDGSDVGTNLTNLFETLNTPIIERSALNKFGEFPYVNGGIFSERLDTIKFNIKMRVALIDAANYDWSSINPTIFGALFQFIKDKEARDKLGEHYTTEENINKVIYPLFLQEFKNRLDEAWDSVKELKRLRADLSNIRILDPACGCGNFLVVAFRHLRQLELELIVRLNELEGKKDNMQLDGSIGLSVHLNQFYGIEIAEWPSQVARIALFLTNHQANLKLQRVTGYIPVSFPINEAANIFNQNALTCNWEDLVKLSDLSFIIGNPPFLGHISRTKEQTQELIDVWGREDIGRLDYVTAWYKKASDTLTSYPAGRFAFVSTNSITQGEPVPALFGPLFAKGWRIRFAHRTFAWSSEAPGEAKVHCVIIGMDRQKGTAQLFNYTNILGEPIESRVKNINAYLIDSVNILVEQSRKILSPDLPPVSMGSMPRDGGYLLINSKEEYESIMKDKIAAKYVKPYLMGNELINNIQRWCLWLVNLAPSDVSKSPELKRRLKAVSVFRLESNAASTRQMADTPHLFGQRSQPESDYLGIPKVFSEGRRWATVESVSAEVVAGDKIYKCDDPDGFAFAIASSSMFITWQKAIGGRLKSDCSFSNTLVWNNLPLPPIDNVLKTEIIEAGKEIIEIRKKFSGSSLAEMYNPLAMNPILTKAHEKLDKLVDNAFGLGKSTNSSNQRETALFNRYVELIQASRI
jgi:hypothetical protein